MADAPHSFEQYDQGNGRVTGESQTRKVAILHLVQSPFAKELFHRLKSKDTMQNAVLDLVEGKLSV